MLLQSIFFNDLYNIYDLDLLVDLAGEAAEDDQPISVFFIRQWMKSTDPKIANVGKAAFLLLLGQDALRLIGALSARQATLEGLRAEARGRRDKHESDNLKERIMRVNRLTVKAHKRYVRRFERYHDNVRDDV